MSDEFREAVRQLHQPVWYRSYGSPEQVWLVCQGCDEGAHAESPAWWPCQTAELAYTAEEIAAREPRVPKCSLHGLTKAGYQVKPPAVFIRHTDGTLDARRFNCDHVEPVPLDPGLAAGWP